MTGSPGPRIEVETEGPNWSPAGRLLLVALCLAGAALVVVAVVHATGRSEDERVADAVAAAAPATVQIEARSGGKRSGLGSGWVLDAGQGLVVTAADVVNRGRLFFARDTVAQVVGAAPCEDLAVLRVKGGLGDRALAFGDAGRGDTVVALGFPAAARPGDPPAPARGSIGADVPRIPGPAPDVPPSPRALRTEATLDTGYSGGPLVDLDGDLAGMSVLARTGAWEPPGHALQPIGYAISADRVEAVVGELRAGRSSGWMGAQFDYPSDAIVAGVGYPPGIWIVGVLPGSGAARAGLRDGDYVVSVDGRPVGTTLAGWCAAAGRVRSGQVAELGLVRGSRARETVPVRFG